MNIAKVNIFDGILNSLTIFFMIVDILTHFIIKTLNIDVILFI